MLSVTDFESKNSDFIDSNKRIILAYSGGLDSSVLLSLLSSTIDHKRLLIWHVNHQLQEYATHMEYFCEAQVAKIGLAYKVSHLQLSHLSSNIESQAREARYMAFSKCINNTSDILLTAHHADDQLETILLNICRGTGVLGLRGIGRQVTIKKISCFRPLLSFSRSDLEIYAKQQNIEWVEDPSNVFECYDRNFIRHNIAPNLKNRWPSILGSFQQVSEHQKEAADCLNELAQLDYSDCVSSHAYSVRKTLDINSLRLKSKVRQKNLIRFFLANFKLSISTHQLNLLVHVISRYKNECKKVHINDAFLGLFNGELFCVLESDIKSESAILLWLEEHEDCYFCRLNKDKKNISSHYLKRQYQAKKIPPWLRDQAIFCLSERNSKHIVETIVL